MIISNGTFCILDKKKEKPNCFISHKLSEIALMVISNDTFWMKSFEESNYIEICLIKLIHSRY